MYQRCEFDLPLNGVEVTAYSRWDDLCKELTPSERPVVLNRASSTNTTNPFGSTFCYGYQDVIFEVIRFLYFSKRFVYDIIRRAYAENRFLFRSGASRFFIISINN